MSKPTEQQKREILEAVFTPLSSVLLGQAISGTQRPIAATDQIVRQQEEIQRLKEQLAATEIRRANAARGYIQLSHENAELCEFINREMKMTGDDPRMAELVKRMAAGPNGRDQ